MFSACLQSPVDDPVKLADLIYTWVSVNEYRQPLSWGDLYTELTKDKKQLDVICNDEPDIALQHHMVDYLTQGDIRPGSIAYLFLIVRGIMVGKEFKRQGLYHKEGTSVTESLRYKYVNQIGSDLLLLSTKQVPLDFLWGETEYNCDDKIYRFIITGVHGDLTLC